MHKTLPHHKKPASSARRVFGSLFFIVLAACAVCMGVTFRSLPSYRQTVLVTGEESYLISFPAKTGKIVVVHIPSDAYIRALYGYGAYRIDSLFELDRIDHKEGVLVGQSVSDAFGVPIRYVVSTPKFLHESDTDAERVVKEVFSWSRLFSRGSGRLSVPFSLWIRWTYMARSSNADAFSLIDTDGSLVPQTVADGSVQHVVDENKLDYITDTSFVDSVIRNEGVTVSVYNTSDIGGVGQRTARMLTKSGVKLVFVGSAASSNEQCLVSGRSDVLKSITAQFIVHTLSCDTSNTQTVGIETGSDIIVELGREYAKRYAQ